MLTINQCYYESMATLNSDYDDLFYEVAELVVKTRKASASYIQRCFNLGYARSAKILDELEEAGVIGEFGGSVPRQVLIDNLDNFSKYKKLKKEKIININFLENTIKKLWSKITSIFSRQEIVSEDPVYYDAVQFIKDKSYITYNQLQRGLNIGYARTSQILELLEKNHKVGPQENGKEKRKVITKN